MQFLTEWIRNIIIFLLMATVLHMLLPNSGLQKYVKFVVSLLLVVLILTPLFKLLQTDVQDVIAGMSTQNRAANSQIENLIDTKKKEIQASQRAYILEQMAVQMKKQVANELESEYGMTVVDLHVSIPEEKDPESQQDIQAVTVTVAEVDEELPEAVETVRTVEIDTNKPYESRMDSDASQHIQHFLSQEWQLDASKIKVQTEGGIGRTNER